MNTIKKNTGTVIDCGEEADMAVNTEKTRYACVLMSRHKNAGTNRNTQTGNRSFENVAQFKCYGTTGTNENLLDYEIKRSVISDYACCRSFGELLFSRLLCESRGLKHTKYNVVSSFVCV
jgi:hypothetical protein